MGKTRAFKHILAGFTTEKAATPPHSNGASGERLVGSDAIRRMTPEQRRAWQSKAHTALREGLMVFMSKDTVAKFSTLLKTPKVTTTVMRRLLEAIANGSLVLTAPSANKMDTAETSHTAAAPVHYDTRTASPLSMSVEQLSAGFPFTLKQAARLLNVGHKQLYFRCITGRIRYEKDRSRYMIPAAEVERLRVIGL